MILIGMVSIAAICGSFGLCCGHCNFIFFSPDSDDEDEDAEVDVAGDGDCEELLDGMAPTSKHKTIARHDALNKCLGTGEYPEFTGLTGW